MSNAERRRSLFDLYSANLALHLPQSAGKFICPNCCGLYGPEAVIGIGEEEPLLSLAHVYPEAAGGKSAVLTCKKCNSDLGGQCDSQLDREHKLHAAHQAGQPIDAHLSVEGNTCTLPVKVLMSDKSVIMRAVHSSKYAEKVIHAASMSQDKPFKFTIRWNVPTPARHKIALLHSAHLCLFRDFGYEYLYADTEWVRGILTTTPPPDTLPSFGFFDVPKETPGVGPALLNVSGVAMIDGTRCFVANFPSPDAKLFMRCILLPGPGKENADAYWQLIGKGSGRANFRYSLCAFEAEPRLRTREGTEYLQELWWKVTNDQS